MLECVSLEAIRDTQNINGNILPRVLHTVCPKCNQLSFLSFTNRSVIPPINFSLGTLQCNICEQESLLILLDGEVESNKVKDFKEMWISPAPKNHIVEAPEEVDDELRNDFKEAVLCLKHSPRASAILLRYCLQKLLRKKAGVTERNLQLEIDKTIENGGLPTYIQDVLHSIRSIGNFAAHPNKDKDTDEMIDVEVEEVEWVIDALRQLFDFYYVEPAKTRQMKDKVNEKLRSMGRNTI